MGAEPVIAVGEVGSPCERDLDAARNPGRMRSHETFTSPPTHLKIAERPLRTRVQRLLDIAGSLLQEMDSLARDKAFTEHANRLQGFNLAEGVDFYGEVERFESGLIRLALDQTGGHQARAAKLLHIKPTTLNSKIKMYGIEY